MKLKRHFPSSVPSWRLGPTFSAPIPFSFITAYFLSDMYMRKRLYYRLQWQPWKKENDKIVLVRLSSSTVKMLSKAFCRWGYNSMFLKAVCAHRYELRGSRPSDMVTPCVLHDPTAVVHQGHLTLCILVGVKFEYLWLGHWTFFLLYMKELQRFFHWYRLFMKFDEYLHYCIISY